MKKETQNKISLLIGLIILTLLLPKKSMAYTFFEFGWKDMLQVFYYVWLIFKMLWWILVPIIVVKIFIFWFEKKRDIQKTKEYNSTKGQIK
jgi:uncharacterized membrane protein